MNKRIGTVAIIFFVTSLVGVVAVMMPKAMSTKDTLGTSVQSTPSTVAETVNEKITQTDLATHNGEASCWIQIDQSVYDVTNFLDKHPGGREALLQFCGTDATRGYATKGDEQEAHSKTADGIKKTQYVGEISL